MYEMNTDKVVVVCMTMIRIYAENVTASNQKSDI